VCGGAGDSFLGLVKSAGVDAYVTADLRHHPASEHVESGGPALVDVAHWASEWPWCEQAAEILREAFGGRVDVLVSTRRTDPWTVGATSSAAGGHA
jgi:putative NIF3 family GTP cyclohydrolase 1 type 2